MCRGTLISLQNHADRAVTSEWFISVSFDSDTSVNLSISNSINSSALDCNDVSECIYPVKTNVSSLEQTFGEHPD